MNAEAVLVVNGQAMGSGSWADCGRAAESWQRLVGRGGVVEVLSLANAISKGIVEE